MPSNSKNLLNEPLSFEQINVGDVITVKVCGKNTNRATYQKLQSQPIFKKMLKNKTYKSLFENRKSKESSGNCVKQILELITVTEKIASTNKMNPSVIIGRTGRTLFGDNHLFISDRDEFYKFDNITDKGNALLSLSKRMPDDVTKTITSYIGGKTTKKYHDKKRRMNKATRSKKTKRSTKTKRSKKI